VEGRNSFKVVGKTGAVLTGRADLVAVRDGKAIVIDCKTGKYRSFHAFQVRLYMYFLGHHQSEHPAHGCSEILGRVLYNHCKVDIPAAAVKTVPEILKRYMPLLISDTAPTPTPSYSECRFCDIGKELCPERIDTEPSESSTDLF
jgi:CRISPR/Cas system-associated exonuclease Cas4 (RecB family)